MDNQLLTKIADNIRVLSAAMPEQAKSGHPGGAMGGADFMAILFTEFLEFDPTEKDWFLRDRFFLDPGHMSPMIYSTLSLFGGFTLEELSQFRQWESPTPGHPELEIHRGIENTSGPLGQGHAMALGSAIAERFLVARFGETISHKTYTYISDGGIQEEISQGVGRLAGLLGLSNLIMFYDSNDIQLSSKTEDVTIEDTKAKYEAWGWRVEDVANGSDFDQLRNALNAANSESERPTLIIGKTIMGKGALTEDGDSYERKVSTHGMPLSKAGASFEKTISSLGGDPENPFQFFGDVASALDYINKDRVDSSNKRKEAFNQWKESNKDLNDKLESFIEGKLPTLDFSGIEQKAGAATRAGSKAVLGYLANNVENMIVTSADLSNSDNTDGFLKETTIFRKGDFSGAFLQAGVSELTMAGIMNGVALHGGCIIAGATFFVFSDYMKPAARLAALMELPVIYIWTHDAFRVGEDGPTHQPVEQETQIRLLEKMNNLSGKRSFLALRPGDVEETSVAWEMALENREVPSCLILTRQNVKNLPTNGKSGYESALQVKKGAYVVIDTDSPDITLLANGSEVSLLVEAAEKLAKDGIKAKVVSAPSEGLFKDQSTEYQNSILPFGQPTLGWTAGLPLNLENLVGPMGKVFGMERFGASAPFNILDEKFGFTSDNVVSVAKDYLVEYKETLNKIKAL
ncbi:MAG: transketolase [Planctomycetota bacterium]|nr:MAG: transketolase [Planctomycetota bacterium]